MATFRTSQCQDGNAVVRCYEGRRQMAFRLKDALEDLNTRKKTSRRILTGILSKHLKNSSLNQI